MHMANELLSGGVAAGTIAVAAGAVGLICHKAKQFITTDKFALMGIMGAFVFAAQMVHFPLPLLPGTSGHMIGAVLLSIILGPSLAAIVLSSVVIVQCLIFQDGGLLAIGCNTINLAIAPTFLGYYVYRFLSQRLSSPRGIYVAAVAAATVALIIGAVLVAIQTWLSGVLLVPLSTFMTTMVAVHIPIGIIEGFITAAVMLYLRQVRPEIFGNGTIESSGYSKRAFYATILLASLVVGAGLSLVAADNPDGLEWSYSYRPDQPDFEPIVSNASPVVAAADNLQSRYSPLPNYTIRSKSQNAGHETGAHTAMGWTSFAAVAGSAVTMLIVWLTGWAIRKRNGFYNAPCPN